VGHFNLISGLIYTNTLIAIQLAAREIYAWSRCQHRNVVPLLGFTFMRGQVAMISPWMENGPLPQYLLREKKVDRFGVVCIIY
jgi:hypothetical protein